MEKSTRMNGSKTNIEVNIQHVEGMMNNGIAPTVGRESVDTIPGQKKYLQFADDEIKESGLVEVDNTMRQRGLRICKEFLAGSWKNLKPEDFHMDRIHGGLSNLLYLCSMAENVYLKDDEPRKVVLRIYGQIIQENPDTVLTDSVMFALLAEKTMGPKLYGVFTGGRVEEYVPSRVLHTDELHVAEISTSCARIMARFHKLTMPIVKQPRWLFDVITRYLDEALNNLSFPETDAVKKCQLDTILSFNLATERDALRSLLDKVHSPVVFCHNDLQEGNILFVHDSDTEWHLRPIDFEYSSYNYRGFDIGNHFCEWCYNYKSDTWPNFIARLNDYPNEEQQLTFIRAYLEEYSEPDQAAAGEYSSILQTEQAVMLEANAFALASHFLWGLWGIVQSHISDIEFGYLDYSLARFNAYFEQKNHLLEKHAQLRSGGDAH